VLTATGDFIEYLWSTSDTTQSITITEGGIYSVVGYTETGCSTEDSINAPSPIEPFALQEICMVTQDSILEKNVLIYEPVLNVGVDSILCYRLNNLTSEYDWIGSNHISDSSIFLDTASIPAQQSYQYKIAIRDTCTHVSDLSPMHQTILLQANIGVGNEINLYWNPYVGFDYPNFGILRSVNAGEYFLIATVPNNIYSFIDLNPPNGQKKYKIRIDKNPPCNPQKKSLSFVESNPVELLPVSNSEFEFDRINIYPNPFETTLIIERPISDKNLNIDILDISGRKLGAYMFKLHETTLTLSISNLSPGIYFLCFNDVFRKLIVKSK